MCLAIPMRLVEVRGVEGVAEVRGVTRRVDLRLCPDAEVGAYLLVHAGSAIARVDEEEAARTLALLDEAIAREDALS
ncbi:MAG: HypC/HybG/HupF family hydrogenase formation chaperone [Planctomycetes bacterium]|nr:HypC/HybG/HupF family hydrogenase formation chaperone [Planctomycetota bacterium]